MTGQFTHYKNNPKDSRSLSNNEARWLYVDRAGTLWVSTAGGLNRYNAASDDFTSYVYDPKNPNSLSNNITFKIREDQYNRLWIGTKGVDLGGLNVFDPQTQQFINYSYDPSNPNSISHNDIRDVFIDRSGVLWIGTRGGGVNKLDLKPEKFQHVTRNPNLANTLHGNLVFSLAEDAAGNLWIGTDGGGLNSYNPGSGLFTYYDMKNSAISNDSILAIQIDRTGSLWLGTKGGGLNRFDPQTAQFTVYQNNPSDPRSLSNNQVYALLQDREGRLWIGTDDGLNLFNPTDQTFTRFMSDPQNPKSLSNKSVLSLMQAQDGALWVGTWGGGVNKLVFASSPYPYGEPQFTVYQRDLKNPSSLSNNEITALLEDNNRYVWVGTNGGLNKLDPPSGVCTRYFIEQGLPSNDIAGLLEDETGTLWISTSNGLASLDPMSQTFNSYDIEDGLQSIQFKDGAAYRGSSGQLFFGGVNGYSYFSPSDIKHNSIAPPVVLTSFKIFEQPVPLPQSVSYLNSIELTYKDNLFSFEFAALDYTHTADNRFAYQMEGFDKDWVYSGQRNYVSYSNLDAGQYVFRVKASNSDGVWNETGLALQITIFPAWWETLWFRALAAILLLGAVVVVFWWRTEAIRTKKDQLEQQLAEQIRQQEILRSNEHRTRESEEKFKSAFMTGMDAFYLATLEEGLILEVNDNFEQVWGYRREEVIGKTSLQLGIYFDPSDRARMVAKLKTNGYVRDLELKGRKKDGDIISITISVSILVLNDKKHILGIIRDITERKRAEAETQQLRNKAEISSRLAAVGEMAAGIAHEINNPLTSVIGFSELLVERQDLPEDVKGEIKIIANGSTKVKDIVRRMLTFARQTKPVRVNTSINELIENTLCLRAYVLRTANIEVCKHLDLDLPLVTVDPGQIQQVFLNLIVNAEYAMKKAHGKGNLIITTEKKDGHIRISFKDDGMGMSSEVKAKLFNPFFTTKPIGEGTGLGLGLSRSIVLEHGGTIEVESEPDQGATFIITLPLTQSAEEASIKAHDITASTTEKVGPAKFLVVDDEENVRKVLNMILANSGHTVDATGDVSEALAKLESNSYDVILIDIRMPGMNGMELYAAVMEKHPEVKGKFIFMSGDPSDLQTRDFFEQNKLSYISKPFDRETLMQKVNGLL